MLVGVCYRTPTERIFGHSNHNQLRELIKEVGSKHHILMGDFNYPGIQWSHYEGQLVTPTEEAKLFHECVEDKFITQHVTAATRNESLLDLVLTKEPDMVTSLKVIEKFAEADHRMLQWDIEIKTCSTETDRSVRDYSKADFLGMRAELGAVKWREVLGALSMEEAWTVFRDKLQEVEQKYIPLKKAGKRKKPIWLTYKAISAVKRKHRIYRKYRSNDHPACKAASMEANKEIRRARWSFEKKTGGKN